MVKAYSYLRFSSGRQAEGSSLDRQISKAKAYAAKHGLELDTTLRPDAAVSGYTGKNRTKGSLSEFLAMVEGGRIARGSYLLVEKMDRLSREGLVRAAHQLLSLALGGVKVVTINDEMVFDENADLAAVMHATMKMSAANDYSASLADRVSWGHKEAKRKVREAGYIYSKTGPGWLLLNDARTVWDELPQRVALVRRVFDMSDHGGIGTSVIAQILNREGIKPFRHAEKWHQVTILKLLRNRSVLGEYQPRFRDGKPDGEPIAGYYGEGIIEPAQFYRVQKKLDSTGPAKGRQAGPDRLNDLFRAMGKCASCGGTVNARVRDKDQKVLYHCQFAGPRGCSNRVRYRTAELEQAIISTVSEIDLTPPSKPNDLRALELALAERADLHTKVQRLLSMMVDGDDDVRELYDATRARRAEKDAEIAKLRAAAHQNRAALAPADHQAVLRELKAKLMTLKDEELYAVRARLSAALRSVVDYLTFYEEGYVEVVLLGGFRAYRFDRLGALIGDVQVLPFEGMNTDQFHHGDEVRRAAMARANNVAAA